MRGEQRGNRAAGSWRGTTCSIRAHIASSVSTWGGLTSPVSVSTGVVDLGEHHLGTVARQRGKSPEPAGIPLGQLGELLIHRAGQAGGEPGVLGRSGRE